MATKKTTQRHRQITTQLHALEIKRQLLAQLDALEAKKRRHRKAIDLIAKEQVRLLATFRKAQSKAKSR